MYSLLAGKTLCVYFCCLLVSCMYIRNGVAYLPSDAMELTQ